MKQIISPEMENLITVKFASDGKKMKINCKYGDLSLPIEKTPIAKRKSKCKAIMNMVIPKVVFVGDNKTGRTSTFIFCAPKGWKGGFNA